MSRECVRMRDWVMRDLVRIGSISRGGGQDLNVVRGQVRIKTRKNSKKELESITKLGRFEYFAINCISSAASYDVSSVAVSLLLAQSSSCF